MRSKIALVYNPKGGSSSARRVEALVRALSHRGAEVVSIPTTPEPDSGSNLARQAARQGAETVVAFGGDGTVCQVAEGLRGSGVCLAAYPGGTGNMFARTFYPPPTPQRFAEMVCHGVAQPVDLIELTYTDVSGEQQRRTVLNGFSAGCLSDSIHEVSQTAKRTLGMGAYAVNFIRAALSPKPLSLGITLFDHGVALALEQRASMLVVANTLPPLASFLSRGCNASDGLMDVVSIDARSFFDLVPTGMWTLLGRPDRSRHYRRWRTAGLRIECQTPLIPNIDGDAGPPSRCLDFTVGEGACQVILV